MKHLLEELKVEPVNQGGCTGMGQWLGGGDRLTSYSPSSGEPIAEVEMISAANYDTIIDQSAEAFKSWRMIPSPVRGQVVRDLGNRLRELREPLRVVLVRWKHGFYPT